MVKPALAYLDIIRQVRERFPACRWRPTTSRASTAWSRRPPQRGWLDEQAVALESLTAIRRAGASIILTYWAKDVARWLDERRPFGVRRFVAAFEPSPLVAQRLCRSSENARQ